MKTVSSQHSTEHIASQNLVIGVRDSGVGGLTVAREIKRLLPHARLLYFADTAHVPYGDRAPHEVRFFALSISQWLLDHGAQTLVFACNTTSAHALPQARAQFSVPVIGMIEPGARDALAHTRNNRIGVLATQATVDSNVYSRTLAALNPQITVCEVACPQFVPLVENRRTQTPQASEAACKYLQMLRETGCDTAILGCTHYPLLLPVLQKVAPDIHFIDPARAVAREVQAALPHELRHRETQSHLVTAEDIYFVSGARDGVQFWIENLMNEPNPRIEVGPIFEAATAHCA